jgi:dienelactone hydrolase
MNRAIWIAACVVLMASSVEAAVKTRDIEYKQGNVTFKGQLAYDDAAAAGARRPGILVFPEWWGLTDYPKHRAAMLAELGYVALAADVYGNGQTTESAEEAGKLAGAVRGDVVVMRQRAQAALEALRAQPEVDASRIVAIGYCFGGTVALELARSGADVAGVVAFHAGLGTPRPEDAANIKGRVLVCNGGNDRSVTPEQLEAFKDAMRKAKVDWQINTYGGAVHAFTNPKSDQRRSENIAYNAKADHRSWAAMKEFLAEVFAADGRGD